MSDLAAHESRQFCESRETDETDEFEMEPKVIRKRVLSAALANWVGQFTALVTNFLLAPFILSHVGETQYGILVLVGSVVLQGVNLDLGIRSALIKLVAEHRARGEVDELRGIIATAMWLYCCLGAMALALTLLISPFLPSLFQVPPSEHDTMVTLGLLMGTQLAISITNSAPGGAISGLQRYDIQNAISAVWSIASACLTISVLLSGGGILGIATALVILAAVMQLVYILCLKRIAPDLRLTFRGARTRFVRTILSFSTSMVVIDVSNSLQTKADEMVIGAFLPVSFVSPYSLARRLSSIPQMIAERFVWGFVPLTSQLEAQGETERLRVLYLTGTRITLAIGLPFAAVVMVLAGPLLTLWVGEQYAKYAPITFVLALAGIVELSGAPGGSILRGLGRHHWLAVMGACAAAAKITLSVLLVRSYGLLGVAVGTLLPTAILTLGWKLPYFMRTLQIPLRDMLTEGLLPVLWPFLLTVAFLQTLLWTVAPSGLIAVGCIAGAGLSVFVLVYFFLFSGDAERNLVGSVTAAFTRRLYAVEK